MKRNTLNLVVDVVTGVVMFGMVATGLVVRFVLPPGSGSRRALWGLGRHDWGDVHFWLAVGLGVLVLIHVALHWQWVCATALRLFRRGATEPASVARASRNLAGLGLLVLIFSIFAGFVWLARLNVREARSAQAGRGVPQNQPAVSDVFIRGSTTLAEAATAADISVDTLRQRLGLGAHVSPTERLGQICRDKGITISDARKLILTPAASGEPQTKP
jgi:hypothetical protein